MKTKHTPAPWILSLDEGVNHLIEDAAGNCIASVWVYNNADQGGTLLPSSDADARLMVAAPQMLHALIAALSCCDVPRVREEIIAAIAKATT
jgi:hypothetical protein